MNAISDSLGSMMGDFQRRLDEKRAADPDYDRKTAAREAEWAAQAARDERVRLFAGARDVADPVAVLACINSPDRCPRIEGHAGSEAAALAVEAFVASPDARTLLLLGGAGRGKSWAATWALGAVGGAFVTATEVRPKDRWSDRFEDAVRHRLLVFDELGGEAVSEWHAHEVSSLIETRHNAGRKTVITSNVPLRFDDVKADARERWKGRTLHDRYGDRLLSRLLDEKFSTVVRCGGDDIRRMKGPTP